MSDFEKKINKLKKYFMEKPSVMMAYIFGSYAKGREMTESDFDIAVYFKPENNRIEYEEEKKYPEEDKIWSDVENIVGINTDLVVMNRCSATLAFEILQTGKKLVVKDEGVWLDYFLIVSAVAEDFREFVKDFYEIKMRSTSLNDRDKNSLRKRISFLSDEMDLFRRFEDMDRNTYKNNSLERKIVERWVENLCNAAIDIAKIILAAEGKKIPDTL